MNNKLTKIFCMLYLLALNTMFISAKNLNTYEKLMTDKIWITTNAYNEKGENISPSYKEVNAFFGLAKYNEDGTFKMYTSEGKLKLSGEWSMTNNGEYRELIAKKDDGSIIFTRTVKNITTKPEVYTYRIYPNDKNKTVYFDIVHEPLLNLIK